MQTLIEQNYKVRRPTWDDLQAVYELEIACQLVDLGKAERQLERVKASWQLPNFDLQRDAWLVTTETGKLVGYRILWNSGYGKLTSFACVHPEYRGQNIGTYLIQLVEERAREMLVDIADGIRVTLSLESFTTNEAAINLFQKAGYTVVRHFWKMLIEMNEAPPEPQFPESVTLRTAVAGQDERAIYEADQDAFRDHWGFVPTDFEMWQSWEVKRDDYDSSLWFLAIDRASDEIAGICLCLNSKPHVGYVDTLGVRRNWRKQGLGLALLQQAFVEFYRRGRRKVELDVDAGSLTKATRLYEKAGMRPIRQLDHYDKELRSGKDYSTQEIEQ